MNTLGYTLPRWEAGAVGVMFGLLAIGAGELPTLAQQPGPPPPPSANVSVFAMGLENPRGVKFGPDGMLYVAEGGRGGNVSSVGRCEQVVPPIGPYLGSQASGRISRITSSGQRTTVTDTFPSSQTSPDSGNLVSGVADIEFLGDTLYAMVTGAGCSHGVADVPNGIARVNADGTWRIVADLGAFLKANPVKNPNPPDFEPDGTWYSMAKVGNDLYAVEPNHGELDKITTAGQISRVADISATQGHVVPTAIAVRDGDFYVTTLGTFPVHRGTQKVYRVTPGGQVSAYASGLTAALGLAFDNQGRLYVLETSTQDNAEPTPGTGRVVRVSAAGDLEVVASSLTTPTAMTFGPDGQLYVSHLGFGPPPGAGQVVRIDVTGIPQPAASPSSTAAGAAPVVRARDGQTLATQSAATQAMFQTVWGDGAGARWVQEHEAELARHG
ncbi:MAG: ScyD/ScyE family protein [Chloroflexota bacterium]|nr:ScyD/ScyE family protein [Chloroflexota bacterium]